MKFQKSLSSSFCLAPSLAICPFPLLFTYEMRNSLLVSFSEMRKVFTTILGAATQLLRTLKPLSCSTEDRVGELTSLLLSLSNLTYLEGIDDTRTGTPTQLLPHHWCSVFAAESCGKRDRQYPLFSKSTRKLRKVCSVFGC